MAVEIAPASQRGVGVLVLIRQDDRLGLVEHSARPVVAVRAGYPVEPRGKLLDQLTALDFCGQVELDAEESGQPPASEVTFLFNVALAGPAAGLTPGTHRWAIECELLPARRRTVGDASIADQAACGFPCKAGTP